MPARILAVSLATLAAPVLLAAAPSGSETTRYCMRVEAVTGSRIEKVECWTRAEWSEQGVDLDRDWPREGVRVID